MARFSPQFFSEIRLSKVEKARGLRGPAQEKSETVVITSFTWKVNPITKVPGCTYAFRPQAYKDCPCHPFFFADAKVATVLFRSLAALFVQWPFWPISGIRLRTPCEWFNPLKRRMHNLEATNLCANVVLFI